MIFEELTRKQQKMITHSLEEQQTKTLKDVEFWENLEWENLGDVQNMYADKQAFETHRKGLLEDKKEDIEILENLLNEIYEM